MGSNVAEVHGNWAQMFCSHVFFVQTIYNAITNGTPCVVVEGSGRVADVIAQVANLPSSKISISMVQKQLSTFFKDNYEQFTESKIVEWTKKVRQMVPGPTLLVSVGEAVSQTRATQVGHLLITLHNYLFVNEKPDLLFQLCLCAFTRWLATAFLISRGSLCSELHRLI